MRLFYLWNVNSYTERRMSLYSNNPQVIKIWYAQVFFFINLLKKNYIHFDNAIHEMLPILFSVFFTIQVSKPFTIEYNGITYMPSTVEHVMV